MHGFGSIKHVRFGGLTAKRWPVVGGVLLVLALAVAFGVCSVFKLLRPMPPEPVYDRQPLSYWLTRRLPPPLSPLAQFLLNPTNTNPDLPRIQAQNWETDSKDPVPFLTRASIGDPPPGLVSDPNAVPFLIEALKPDSWVGAAIYRKQVWPRMPPCIQKRLPFPADRRDVRGRAAFFLSCMEPIAKPAIPALIRALKKDDEYVVRCYAVKLLGDVGGRNSTVVTALTSALSDNYVNVRYAATNALLKLDPEAAAKAGVKMPSP